MQKKKIQPAVRVEACALFELGEGNAPFSPPPFRSVLGIVVEGKGSLQRTDGKQFPLAREDIFILPANDGNEIFSTQEQPLRYFWLSIDGQESQRIFSYLNVESSPVLPLRNSLPVLSSFERLFELAAQEDNYLLFAEFFTLLHTIRDCAAITAEGSDPKEELLQRAANYLELHVDENLKINDLVERLGVARSYFARIFKEKFGESPHQYFLRLKIQQAKKMLEGKGGYSVTQISEALGFSDVFTFSKAFKRELGVSPNEYRKQNT